MTGEWLRKAGSGASQDGGLSDPRLVSLYSGAWHQQQPHDCPDPEGAAVGHAQAEMPRWRAMLGTRPTSPANGEKLDRLFSASRGAASPRTTEVRSPRPVVCPMPEAIVVGGDHTV